MTPEEREKLQHMVDVCERASGLITTMLASGRGSPEEFNEVATAARELIADEDVRRISPRHVAGLETILRVMEASGDVSPGPDSAVIRAL